MDLSRRFGWMATATVVFVIVASIYVTKEFITTILASFFFAYLMNPFYYNIYCLTKNKQLSSLFSIFMVFLIFIIFVIYGLNALATEISNLSRSQDSINSIINEFFTTIIGVVDKYTPGTIGRYLNQYLPQSASQYLDLISNPEQVSQPLSGLANWALPQIFPHLTNVLSGIASSIPILVVQFGVVILLTYYLLMDGKMAIDKMLVLLPKAERDVTSKFLNELNAIYNNLFNVYFVTCALIGIFATVGFLLMDIPYPFLWGMVIFLFSLIPLIGAGTIYIPMALYYLVTQDFARFLALLVFGTIFLNILPENIIRPRLAQRGASIHPGITLLAFAAPLFVVGMVGIVVGPALYGFMLAVYRTRIDILKGELTDSDDEELLSYLNDEQKEHAKTPTSCAYRFKGEFILRLMERLRELMNKLKNYRN